MALYNVPFEDARARPSRPWRTALEFQERTLIVSQALGGEARHRHPQRPSGSTPERRWWGTLGSKQRLEYTAIGRHHQPRRGGLESITKDYKTNIIISESTYALVKDHFVTKELGDVTVKGKSHPVKIYARPAGQHPQACAPRHWRWPPRLSIVGDGRVCHATTARHQRGGYIALKGRARGLAEGAGRADSLRGRARYRSPSVARGADRLAQTATRSASPSPRSIPTRCRRSPGTCPAARSDCRATRPRVRTRLSTNDARGRGMSEPFGLSERFVSGADHR